MVVLKSVFQRADELLKRAMLSEPMRRQLISDAVPFCNDEMSDHELLSSLVMAAVQNIAFDPDYERAAARLMLLQIFREATGTFDIDYATYFPRKRLKRCGCEWRWVWL